MTGAPQPSKSSDDRWHLRERREPTASGQRGGEASDTPSGVDALHSRRTCSVVEAAAALGIGRSTAYAAAQDGSLPTLRISHRLLVPTAKLLAMLGETER
jgi:hypothetical protein